MILPDQDPLYPFSPTLRKARIDARVSREGTSETRLSDGTVVGCRHSALAEHRFSWTLDGVPTAERVVVNRVLDDERHKPSGSVLSGLAEEAFANLHAILSPVPASVDRGPRSPRASSVGVAAVAAALSLPLD